ncbi:hypothetical protein AO889_03295 [Pseudomonas aeruginosa]|nr:hypothetical protein AO889_03295 [Pseudomonas aeruginosa]KSD07916.1 hypothetical protein AO890_03295 [Pseudomonas aeruginosa]KSH27387.1 hypothetical protein AO962_00730 [Pseudomonas aeruginosa]
MHIPPYASPPTLLGSQVASAAPHQGFHVNSVRDDLEMDAVGIAVYSSGLADGILAIDFVACFQWCFRT